MHGYLETSSKRIAGYVFSKYILITEECLNRKVTHCPVIKHILCKLSSLSSESITTCQVSIRLQF